MATGIDSGKITPETTYVDSGSITLNGKTIRNWDLKAYGKQTMSNVIEHSINTGSVLPRGKSAMIFFIIIWLNLESMN